MEREQQGRFVWYDLMTTDVEGAIAFYQQLTGWSTRPLPSSRLPYTLWVNGETPIGGVMNKNSDPSMENVPAHWIAAVSTPDVDATVSRTRELGGTVRHEPMDTPDAGRYAVLADPQGAVFAVYQEPDPAPTPEEGMPGVGMFSWRELATTDHDKAFDFYSKLFGWTLADTYDMGEMGNYLMFGAGKTMLGGMFTMTAEMGSPPYWLYYVHIADINAALQQVEELGGKVLVGAMEVPGGDMIAQCLDPQGAAFALHAAVPVTGDGGTAKTVISSVN